MSMKLTNIQRVISKIKRDLGVDVSPSDAIEWAAEALEAIGAVTQYDECVAFIEVANHKAPIPTGLTTIIQIAKNECFTPEASCPIAVVEEIEETTESSGQPVPLDCFGTPITDYELAYYRPYFDLIFEFEGWSNLPFFRRCFVPVRLKDHSFFNSVVCMETNPAIKDLYQTTEYEYSIFDPYLRFSFQTGQIAIAFNRQRLDGNGYPMIPEHFSYMEAITRYVRYKTLSRMVDIDDKYLTRLQMADQDWHWYCKQAGNYALMHKGVDAHENSMRQENYLLPRQYRYYGFFGNLAQIEPKHWDDTSRTAW